MSGSSITNISRGFTSMLVTRRSLMTNKIHTLEVSVTQEQMDEFMNPDRTRLVQDIFPDLSPELRDFIKLGIHPDEWTLFGDEE